MLAFNPLPCNKKWPAVLSTPTGRTPTITEGSNVQNTYALFDDRLPTRFWDKVRVDQDSGCWLWTGGLNHGGYGRFDRNGRAHRICYQALVGEIPCDLQMDHLCRVRSCCNPEHLEAVTPGENTRRGDTGKNTGKMQRAKTHCPQGHKYDLENTYLIPAGGRACRRCRDEASKRSVNKNREKINSRARERRARKARL